MAINTWAVALALLAGGMCSAMAQSRPVAATNAPSIADVAALQAALDRAGFGVGLVDGKDGPRTRHAFLDYRRHSGLSDRQARNALLSNGVPPTVAYVVTQADLDSVGSAPADWLEAAAVPAMAFETLDEALSEKFHASRVLLRRLNGGLTNWSELPAGFVAKVPNTASPGRPPAAWLEIDCAACRLRAFGADDALIASFPCSIARDLTRVPRGELRIASFAPNPNYTFDPANFPESPRAQEIGRRLILPPGPNNPVGVYWITLSAPGFGIHGTPHPETIGRRESHGCFRLTNWDIATLAGMVAVGTPVLVVGLPDTAPADAAE